MKNKIHVQHVLCFTLAPGNEVYVRNIDFDHETIYGDSYSSFSGMLVWEL